MLVLVTIAPCSSSCLIAKRILSAYSGERDHAFRRIVIMDSNDRDHPFRLIVIADHRFPKRVITMPE